MKFWKVNIYLFLWILISIIFSCKKESPVQKIEIEITPGTLMIPKGQTANQKLVVKQKGSGTSVQNVSWSSSNSEIATVSSEGKVTGKSIGETTITAKLLNGSGEATIKAFVYDLNDYKFRVVLKNKGPVVHSLNKPDEFLSPRTIQRRRNFSIPIDSADIPIAPTYLQKIQNLGAKIVTQSKWLNTVTVHCSDSIAYNKMMGLPFVQSVSLVWVGTKDTASYFKTLVASKPITAFPRTVQEAVDYGVAWDNININKGQVLHDAGFKGNGMEIAVMDVGFINLKNNPALKNISIKGAKSFLYDWSDPFARSFHGTAVTSCMATNQPKTYIGTAPEASYWLFVTEDETSEYPVEEDYWVAALEYADSAGVYIANTSLGYKDFDLKTLTHSFAALDGKTTHAARAANIAAQKGMILVVSAGNDKTYVATPADATNVLTVGAIEKTGNISSFSSNGITFDGRMKPDVLALGTNAAIIGQTGLAATGSGTSFAGPILCGMVACLWQAFPNLTNIEIMNVVKASADRYLNPVLPYGNGIPNMEKAMQLAQSISNSK